MQSILPQIVKQEQLKKRAIIRHFGYGLYLPAMQDQLTEECRLPKNGTLCRHLQVVIDLTLYQTAIEGDILLFG